MNYANMIIKLLSKTIPWALRRHFTEDRMQKAIDISIPSEGDGFRYDGFSQEASCWFTIVNRSPIDIVVDRIALRITIYGYSGRVLYILPRGIPSFSKDGILAAGFITAPPKDKNSASGRDRQVMIEASVVIRSKVRDFVILRYFQDLRNVDIHNLQ